MCKYRNNVDLYMEVFGEIIHVVFVMRGKDQSGQPDIPSRSIV